MNNSEPFNITILSEMVSFPITDLTSMTRGVRVLGERLVPNSAAKSAQITEKLSLPSILSLLQYGDDDLSNATSTLIQRLLEPLPASVILSQFKDWINEGLTSESDQLRELALSVWVNREHDLNSKQLILNTYGTQLLDCIANTESPNVAQLAIKPFVACSNEEPTLSIILSSPILDSIQNLFDRGAIVKTRILDLLVQMASVSKSTYLKIKESNLFSKVDNCIDSEDLLLKLNTLEILVSVSDSHLGSSFLEDFMFHKKVWNNLENHPSEMPLESLESLCYCAELKFIAQSWKLYPSDNELSTQIIKKLEYSLQDKFNNDIKEASVYSFGIIGSTSVGMISLYKQKTALRKFVRFSSSATDRLKVESLRAFALMMGSKKSTGDEFPELIEALIVLYNLLAENVAMPNEFVKLAQNPIEPIKAASYEFLFELSTYHWGIKELVDSSVFMKFIFNRSLDTTYLGMKMKYKIVGSILANHDKPSPILDEKLIKQFKNYLSQGEFYSESIPEVATQNL